MKYCGISAVVTIEETFNPKFKLPEPPKRTKPLSKWEREYEASQKLRAQAEKRLAGKTFKSYRDVAKQLKPGESVVVRVTAAGELGQLLGFGEVEMEKDGNNYSVPRILSHEY